MFPVRTEGHGGKTWLAMDSSIAQALTNKYGSNKYHLEYFRYGKLEGSTDGDTYVAKSKVSDQ